MGGLQPDEGLKEVNVEGFEYRLGKWLDELLIECIESTIDQWRNDGYDVGDPDPEKEEPGDIVINGKFYEVSWKIEEVKDEQTTADEASG